MHRYRSLVSLTPLLTAVGLGLAACQADSLPSEPDVRPPRQPQADVSAGSSDTWASRFNMPTGRYGLVAATVNGAVYAIGGTAPTGVVTPKVEAYVPNTLTLDPWKTKAPLPAPRSQSNGAAVINGEIYVTGGYHLVDGSQRDTRSVYRYNPATDIWTSRANMPRASSGGVSGAINGKLYVYVTFTGQGGPDAALYRYDPTTNSWTERAHPPQVQALAAGSVIGGKLYVMGGISEGAPSRKLSLYDPGSNSWTTKALMKYPRARAAAKAIDGKLYVAGGWGEFSSQTGSQTTGVTEMYDPATNSWTDRASMITPRFGAGAAVANGIFYVIGGLGGDGRLNEAYTP
jgi:N-acetylneuraminic acid mutarotase